MSKIKAQQVFYFHTQHNWKINKFLVYPKQGRFIPFYSIVIHFNCNAFLLSLSDIRRLNIVY